MSGWVLLLHTIFSPPLSSSSSSYSANVSYLGPNLRPATALHSPHHLHSIALARRRYTWRLTSLMDPTRSSITVIDSGMLDPAR